MDEFSQEQGSRWRVSLLLINWPTLHCPGNVSNPFSWKVFLWNSEGIEGPFSSGFSEWKHLFCCSLLYNKTEFYVQENLWQNTGNRQANTKTSVRTINCLLGTYYLIADVSNVGRATVGRYVVNNPTEILNDFRHDIGARKVSNYLVGSLLIKNDVILLANVTCKLKTFMQNDWFACMEFCQGQFVFPLFLWKKNSESCFPLSSWAYLYCHVVSRTSSIRLQEFHIACYANWLWLTFEVRLKQLPNKGFYIFLQFFCKHCYLLVFIFVMEMNLCPHCYLL